MTPTLALLAWPAAGILLGVAYLSLLRRTVDAVAGGNWRAAAGPALLRVALAAAGLGFAAQHGALPLVLVLAGFLLARTAVLRRVREV